MEEAFNALPEQERAEYNNDPKVAFRTRSAQQTSLKSERIQEAHDKRRDPETGKVEISETQKQNVAAANQRRGQEIREGTYTGRPVGRPPKNPETGKIELSETYKQHLTEANQRRGQEIREGTYTGKPVGRSRKSENTIHQTASYRRRHRRTRPQDNKIIKA